MFDSNGLANLRIYYWLTDVAAYLLAIVGVGWYKFGAGYQSINYKAYLIILLLLAAIIAGVRYFQGAYESDSLLKYGLYSYFTAVLYSALAFYILSFYFRFVSFSRVYFTFLFPVIFILAVFLRILLIRWLKHHFNEYLKMPLLLLGLDQAPKELALNIKRQAGLKIIGEINVGEKKRLKVSEWEEIASRWLKREMDSRVVPFKSNSNYSVSGSKTSRFLSNKLGGSVVASAAEIDSSFEEAAAAENTKLYAGRLGILVYETPNLPMLDIIEYCETNYISLYILPSANSLLSVPFRVLDQEQFLLFSTKIFLNEGIGSRVKRLTDIVAALLGLAISSWLFLILWSLVRLTSPGPGFFAHERLGLNGKKIRVFKFRTMVQNADKRLEELLQDEKFRREWDDGFKLTQDPRVTPLGRFLRRTSLDELPQLFNILRGDISLVGPRPIVPKEKERYGDQAKFILRVKPGLTGLWQVSGRSAVSYEERIRMDTYYIHNWSLLLDLQIILQTVPAVLKRKGAV